MEKHTKRLKNSTFFMGLFIRKPHQYSTRSFSLSTILKKIITKWCIENKDMKCQTMAFAWNFKVDKNSGQCFHASAFLLRILGQTSCSWQKQLRAELAQRALTHLVPFFQVLLQPAIPDSWNQQHHTMNPTKVAWKSITTGTGRAN